MSTKKLKGWSLLVLASKFTKLFKALTAVVKGLKAFGPLLTLGTMTLSIWMYSYALGWPLAVLLVLLLLVHELGNVIACRHKGHKVKAPLFIPFVGALIFAPPNMSREEESYIGYGGPFLGSIGAMFVWLLWWLIPSHPDVLLMAAYFGTFLNLFNLMPISPLDGGRILQSVGKWVRWVGLVLLMSITIALQDVGWLFIWLVVLSDFKIRYRQHIAFIVWLLMLVGYATDYGVPMPLFIKIIHLFMGACFVFMMWVESMTNSIETERPPQPKARARFWMLSYLVMAITLMGLMYQQSHLLHPIIEKKKAEQEQANAQQAQ